MRYLIVTVSFVCSLFAASAHAFDESLEAYSRALMKAYVGYNFKKRTESIYYFEYLHGDKRAWTLVTYFKGRKDTFAIQTGIGESSDFISIMESIELK